MRKGDHNILKKEQNIVGSEDQEVLLPIIWHSQEMKLTTDSENLRRERLRVPESFLSLPPICIRRNRPNQGISGWKGWTCLCKTKSEWYCYFLPPGSPQRFYKLRHPNLLFRRKISIIHESMGRRRLIVISNTKDSTPSVFAFASSSAFVFTSSSVFVFASSIIKVCIVRWM